MKLALVSDQPTVSKPARRYVEKTIDACASAAGFSVEWEFIPATTTDQVGRKAPPISLLRSEHPGLMDRLAAFGPDAVVALGAAALNGLENPPKALQVRKEHGRMRMVGPYPVTPTVDPWRVVSAPDLHRDFAGVVYKAMTQWGPLPAMDVETLVCRDVDVLASSLALLEGASVVACDVETTGLRGWADAITAYGLGAVYDDRSGIAVIVPWELLEVPEAVDLLWEATWRRDRRTVGHNMKFDQQFLFGLFGEWTPPEAMMGDTLLLHHLLDERPNQPKARARGSGLKDLVATRYDHAYGFDFTKPFEALTDEEVDELHLYLGEDVAYTARLWHDLVADAKDERSDVLTTHDGLLARVSRAVAKAEVTGAHIDVPWVEGTIRHLEARAARRKAALERAIGPLTPTLAIDNILAPQQVADAMYGEWGMTPDVRVHGKLDTKRSTDQEHVKAAIAKYREPRWRGTIQWRGAAWLKALVNLRKDTRLISVYEKQLLAFRDEHDRVHPGFLLHGASTGRISATQPAIQTIPAVDDIRDSQGGREYKLRDGSWTKRPMRRAFTPRPGYEWVEVDYSQLELRVAAAVTGDQAFMDVFRNGRDVHQEVAASIFSKPYDQVTKPERYLAKAVSFGILYGRTAAALAGGAEMDFAVRELWGGDESKRWTEATAQAFITKFMRSYPALQDWITDLHKTVPVQGYVETFHGRRRRFPLVTDRELGAIRRQAVNTPIQGAASDICLNAMAELTDAIEAEGLDAVVLFPVHDSICLEVRAEEVPALEALCRRIMEVDWPVKGMCPLKVDFEHGPSWADVTK